MSSLSLRLPDSLHAQIRELAARDDVSINQFIATAVAEKAAAMLTVEYLEQRAKRGSRAAFDRILARVPNAAPIPGDEMEDATQEERLDKRLYASAGAKRRPRKRRAARPRRG